MELKPARILDLDALADGLFEWLYAERAGLVDSDEFSRDFREPDAGLKARATYRLGTPEQARATYGDGGIKGNT